MFLIFNTPNAADTVSIISSVESPLWLELLTITELA